MLPAWLRVFVVVVPIFQIKISERRVSRITSTFSAFLRCAAWAGGVPRRKGSLHHAGGENN